MAAASYVIRQSAPDVTQDGGAQDGVDSQPHLPYVIRQSTADVTKDGGAQDGVDSRPHLPYVIRQSAADVTQDGGAQDGVDSQPHLPIFYVVSSKAFPDNLLNRLGLLMKQVPAQPTWRQPHPEFIPPPRYEFPYHPIPAGDYPPYYPYAQSGGYAPYDPHLYYPQRPDRYSEPVYSHYGYPHKNPQKKKKPPSPEHYYQNDYYFERPQYSRPPKPTKLHRPPPNYPQYHHPSSQYAEHQGYQPSQSPSYNKNKPRPHLERIPAGPASHAVDLDATKTNEKVSFSNLSLPTGVLKPSLKPSPSQNESVTEPHPEENTPTLHLEGTTTFKPEPPVLNQRRPDEEPPLIDLDPPTASTGGVEPYLKPPNESKPGLETIPHGSIPKAEAEGGKEESRPIENPTPTNLQTVGTGETVLVNNSWITVDAVQPSKQSGQSLHSAGHKHPVVNEDETKPLATESKPSQDFFTIQDVDVKDDETNQGSVSNRPHIQPVDNAEAISSKPNMPHIQPVDNAEAISSKPNMPHIQPVANAEAISSKPNMPHIQPVENAEAISSKPNMPHIQPVDNAEAISSKPNMPHIQPVENAEAISSKPNMPHIQPVDNAEAISSKPNMPHIQPVDSAEAISSKPNMPHIQPVDNAEAISSKPNMPHIQPQATSTSSKPTKPSFPPVPPGGAEPTLKPPPVGKPHVQQTEDEVDSTPATDGARPLSPEQAKPPTFIEPNIPVVNLNLPQEVTKPSLNPDQKPLTETERKALDGVATHSEAEGDETRRKHTNTMESRDTDATTSQRPEKDPAVDVLFVLRKKPSALAAGDGSSSVYPYKTLGDLPVVRYAPLYDPTPYEDYWGSY